jgi:preprotein translocase subunit SecA
MLNVLDEKWKDHLYDLDQLRGAIHYRSWGQKDPLIEYKQEAYTMFVDLMSDIHHTFTERYLRAQLVFNAPPMPEPEPQPVRPRRRFNALGILEDIPDEVAPEAAAGDGTGSDGNGDGQVMDVGPDEPPKQKPVAKADPVVVGAGRARPLSQGAAAAPTPADWTSVGRNDPCPCGSGKKFKKCHGMNS